jgi:zinc transporter ZupT
MQNPAHFVLLLISSLTLPFLAILALALRQSVVTGKARLVVFSVAVLGISYALFQEVKVHGKEFGLTELFIALLVSALTYLVLSRSHRHHKHGIDEAGIKGIVIAEAFHSLFDGLAIGVAFLATPLIGIGALAGIVVHELPKMIATLALIRSTGVSLGKTVVYGALSQAGVPVAAVLIYLIGYRIETEFQAVDAAVLSSLSTIVLYILYKELRHHKRIHRHHKH